MKIEKVWFRAALGAALIGGIAGCHGNSVNAQSGPDPAAANLAQPGTENEAQQQAGQYQEGQQPPAPIERDYPEAQQPGYDNGQGYAADQDYEPVDDADLMDWQASEPPPPLPDYDQPPDPDPDYIWTPGYWAWGPEGYYWVPGCWVAPPYVGALWTPGYWGFVGSAYRFHHGYWGRHVGFYGGIDYGFGYFGLGYEGGYWNGPRFYYNTAVTHVDQRVVRNVYVHNVASNRGPRTSFDGGRGGLQVRPRAAETAAMHEQRYAPMQSQVEVRDNASRDRQQFYSANHGRPAQVARPSPLASDHRMPAELPRAAAMTARPNTGGRPAETARPGQAQQQGRPELRNAPQQGGQAVRPEIARPDNTPRGNAAPEAARPGQPGRENFPQNRPEARPAQPHNEMRQAAPQPESRPQYQPRVEQHAAPQPQPQQQRPETRPQPQQRPEMRPQPQRQPPPQTEMRQGPPPQAQRQPPPQARPQPQHQPGPPQQHGPPQQAHPQPQQHEGPHDNGHQDDKH